MIDFEARIAVGLCGEALLDLTAEVGKSYEKFENGYTAYDAAMEDIMDLGFCEWFEYLPIQRPKPGIYKIVGTIRLTEDESEFSNLKIFNAS